MSADNPETTKRKRNPGDLYVELFRPHVETRTPTLAWIGPGMSPGFLYIAGSGSPGTITIRPSQPWRWLAKALRWLSFRCLLWAKRAEFRGLCEPEITERTILESLRDLQAQAESFKLPDVKESA